MINLLAQKLDIYEGDGKHQYARTGELSAHHLTQAGATGVLLGHSEAGETTKEVHEKLLFAPKEGLVHNIILFGEKWEDLGKPWSELDETHKKRVMDVVKNELSIIVKDVGKDVMLQCVLSYEPEWGVRGSGKADVAPPQPDQIETTAQTIREFLKETYGESVSAQIRIVYGGSMSPERAGDIAPLTNIDGFILGSAGSTSQGVMQIAQALKSQNGRKPVLALNWKAYELKEPYEKFLEVLRSFEDSVDIYLVPPATDLYLLKSEIKRFKM